MRKDKKLNTNSRVDVGSPCRSGQAGIITWLHSLKVSQRPSMWFRERISKFVKGTACSRKILEPHFIPGLKNVGILEVIL